MLMKNDDAAKSDDEAADFCLMDIVYRLMAETKFTPELARDRLIELADTDTQVRDTLIMLGARQAMRNYVHRERSAATVPPEMHPTFAPPASTSAPLGRVQPRIVTEQDDEVLYERVQKRLFWDRYCIYGGAPISLATKKSLQDSVASRRSQARGNEIRANFEESVSRRVPADRMVKQVLSNDALLKMARKHEVPADA